MFQLSMAPARRPRSLHAGIRHTLFSCELPRLQTRYCIYSPVG
ncbi:hypothetical protein CABS02_02669 [Colletotrichum abscissum]|uniref:Uncharacterized protein n=1 Tax=Colletotrichum abscissum TaxID=1671311 RepID=A0A9Q0B8I0_9PEZI|nr:hypothetical protein CABS02_02669 [Colletotrichum abscissum]